MADRAGKSLECAMKALPRATHGRPRGFLPDWRPQARTAAVIEHVREVLAEYHTHLPLTIRQIFYRLVAMHGFEKTERGYKQLCEILNRARRAQLVPFEHIRDDGFHRSERLGWPDIEAAKRAIVNTADRFRLDRQTGQPRRLALWCEASGMMPQLARVAEAYSVPVFSSGGFDSLTIKFNIAEEFSSWKRVKVLHIGDHDPSGIHVFHSLAED